MDAYKAVGNSKGSYMVSDLDQTYIFHDVLLPPPSGVFVQNYVRYVVALKKTILSLIIPQVYLQWKESTHLCHLTDNKETI